MFFHDEGNISFICVRPAGSKLLLNDHTIITELSKKELDRSIIYLVHSTINLCMIIKCQAPC